MENRTPNTQCVICGKPVYRRPNQLAKTNGRAFCSNACYGIHCRNEHPCIICGSPIIASVHKKTCSPECLVKWNVHPDRKHCLGRKKVENPAYGTRSFRVKFLSDRGDACEICGYKVSEVLQIHHIVERINGGSDDEENLLLLCRNCHGEIHCGILKLGE